jgi:hypothetical protein
MYEWFVQDTFRKPGPALSDEATARTVNFRCEALTHFTESTSGYCKRSNATSLGQSTQVIMLQVRFEFVATTTDREITIKWAIVWHSHGHRPGLMRARRHCLDIVILEVSRILSNRLEMLAGLSDACSSESQGD